MRVVAGTARGRRLRAPVGAVTRPTPDRVREAVFNSLHSRGAVAGARVLDLYAGTGALGIEALSRGASSAVFVESDRRALRCLSNNLASTGLAERASVMASDVDAALRELHRGGRAFDLAVIDPPYAFDAWPELLARVPAALAVIESDREIDVGRAWDVDRSKRYGTTVVMFTSSRAAVPTPAPAFPAPAGPLRYAVDSCSS